MDVEFAGRLDPPTTLAEIEQSNLFGDWALVSQGRLSTMARGRVRRVDAQRYPKTKI